MTELGPNEEHDYITYDLLVKYVADPTKYTYCTCGPQHMIDSMTSMLRDNGVARTAIQSEEFAW